MKRYFSHLPVFCWLLLSCTCVTGQLIATTHQTYSSVNPKTDANSSYTGMLYIDYSSLFELGADLSGGVIGDISSGGQIKLEVYSFDDQATDGKGSLVYGIYTDATSSNYTAKTWDILLDVSVAEGEYRGSINAKSSAIKTLIRKAHIFIPNDAGHAACKEYAASTIPSFWHRMLKWFDGNSDGPPQCAEFFQGQQPVIIEVTLNNATFYKMKVPGIGEFSASDLFIGSKPFAVINGKVTLGSHRGNWQDVLAPENTKSAVADMIAENYDMIELDLWVTSDDSIIVFHDMGLNKRTIDTGNIRLRTWSSIQNLYIKNRFDEVIQVSNAKIELLSSILNFIRQQDPQRKIWLNLDRSANDTQMFKKVYKVVERAGMLDRAIFKGRFDPANTENAPTAASIRHAFTDMFPSLSQTDRNNKMKLMHYTPVLFDNNKKVAEGITNDDAFASRVRDYIDAMIYAGIADGFELNFKSYPVGSADFANATDDNVFLLKQWSVLGNQNFVQYVHSKGLPVGIFASVPEVCAIPDFNSNGTRNPNSLVSGFVKEDPGNFTPVVNPQKDYDFRGDWDFYILAGVDYVITDRPDALREFLKAIGRFQ